MIVDWKVWVRKRAYTIWEAEGRPEGRHEEHWYRAEQEITPEETPPQPTSATLDMDAGVAGER